MVTNADEWKFFKQSNRLRTPLERDLFHIETDGTISLFLNAMESVHIPFKYDPLGHGNFEVTSETFEVKVFS